MPQSVTVNHDHFIDKAAVERTDLGNALDVAERRVEQYRQLKAFGVETADVELKAAAKAVVEARAAIVAWHKDAEGK